MIPPPTPAAQLYAARLNATIAQREDRYDMATTTKKKPAKKTTKPAERPVLITTANRGVFFGYTTEGGAPETMTIRRARNVIYWPAANRGFLGLAADGPAHGARIGPQVPGLALRNVTSVSDVTAEAVAKFEAAPWA
jgi:hypothetical protein